MSSLTSGATLAALAEVFANETAKHNGIRQPVVQGPLTSAVLFDAKQVSAERSLMRCKDLKPLC